MRGYCLACFPRLKPQSNMKGFEMSCRWIMQHLNIFESFVFFWNVKCNGQGEKEKWDLGARGCDGILL